MTPASELQRLIRSNAAFTPPLRILAAIPSESWIARPSGVPHSIVEELWHIVYWMDHFLACAQSEPVQFPDSSEQGWKAMDSLRADELESLLIRFTIALDHASGIVSPPIEVLCSRQTTFQEPGMPPLTMAELAISLAVHNAYHFGRIVQIRQILGSWPPPGGGDRW
jgi:hypothetical protein